ncbi:MAG: cation transporter [Bacteroidota bacterium]|nr:cation transporter [Bacteroidota bacterium]
MFQCCFLKRSNIGGGRNLSPARQSLNYNRLFGYGVVFNVSYIIVEIVYGLRIDSMALLADAGHNFGDVLSLMLAWGATSLAKTAATKNRTYGLRKSTILASLFNAIILLIVVGAIAIESLRKIFEPQSVGGMTMTIIAGVGVVVNTLTALLFVKGRKSDLNMKAAFLHMAADAGISLGIVVAGLFIIMTGYVLLDPIVGLAIIIVITAGTWNLLKDSVHLSMDAVPRDIDVENVKKFLTLLDGVEEVHDLHVWAMSTTETALTAHLVMPREHHDDKFLGNVCGQLYEKFGIEHSTIQVERNAQSASCAKDKV